MAFCLLPRYVQAFKEGLKSGEINPEELSSMDSDARREFLAKYVGELNAQQTNALFESKLLLKNQQQGMITWAKKLTGITPETKRDLISKIERMDTLLDPKGVFLNDLVNTRLRVNVTREEARNIYNLSKKVVELKQQTDVTKSDVVLGRAKLALTEYVNSINPKKANLVTNIAGVPRSLMASLDLSAPLNQGWGMISRKRFYTSLRTMLSSVKSEENFKDLQAYIITHPDYENAKRSGLRITEIGDKLEQREEQFMSSLLDRVPGINASQRAYVGFLNKLRMDSFSDFLRKAEIAGEDVSMGSPASKDIANMVNNFTGGARVGRVEGAVPILNSLFFSPRKIKSTLEIMNPVNYVNPNVSKTARREATRNLIGSLAVTASAIALYGFLTGEEPEKDPTSADFGKIKSGDTRVDVTGGNATYLRLLATLVTGRRKGASGVTTELGTGYGETSAFDVIAQFLRYKLSPNASLFVDAVSGENAIGEKKTISQSVMDRFKPMFLSSVYDLLNSDTEGKFGFVLAGLFGAGLNTYNSDADWTQKTTKEMIDFREQIGEEKFKEANKKYNEEYDNWFKKTREDNVYKNLTDEEREKLILDTKDVIKKGILKEYGYKKSTKKPKTVEEIKKDESVKKLKPISGLIDNINQVVSRLTPEVFAADDSRFVKNLKLTDDDRVEIFYNNGDYKNVPLDNFIDENNFLGKILNDVGTGLGLPELNLSEKVGYLTREQKIKEFEKRVSDLQGVVGEPTQKNELDVQDEKSSETVVSVQKAVSVAPKEGVSSFKKNVPLIEEELKKSGIDTPEVLAYAIATTQHETANTFNPVNEGDFNDKKYGYDAGFTGRSEARKRGYEGGEDYFGRGFIQLTHKSNYRKYGDMIGVDLVKNPELANDPVNAAKILALFFKETGVADLIKEGKITEARRKINPDNKGRMIMETYEKYLNALQ